MSSSTPEMLPITSCIALERHALHVKAVATSGLIVHCWPSHDQIDKAVQKLNENPASGEAYTYRECLAMLLCGRTLTLLQSWSFLPSSGSATKQTLMQKALSCVRGSESLRSAESAR